MAYYERGNFRFLALGVFIHVLYLSSVFYIYFKSPILHGLNPVETEASGPAKRLVLFVADGLQADKAFHRENEKQTSFLRNIIKTQGQWGVSHTRVPTESRVGHVSLMAGTYEDVSAITNGWKDNPVEFDSLFNQSYKTWCWGSPDILHIFDKRDNDNIVSYSYKAEEIDFASKDPSTLDKWVFDHVEDFFNKAQTDATLIRELQTEKIVFFLHLLGIDTNGHSKKPDSDEYLANIALVDEGIRKITNVFNNFYKHDGKTAFIVTSDHGMTPWGAHGTGLQSETETPFIAWGAGINVPVIERNINKDRQSMIWGLENYQRTDMKQIDLAPLMSFLTGLHFPANSVGVLPHKVLNVDDKTKALGMLHNARQIKEQYDAHEHKIKQSTFTFAEFEEMKKLQDSSTMVSKILQQINASDYTTAIETSERFIEILLKGINYYHTYNRWSLSVSVNVAFVTWLLILVTKVVEEHTDIIRGKHMIRSWFLKVLLSKLFVYFYSGLVVLVCFILYIKSQDASYVLYTCLPLLMIRILLSKVDVIWRILCHLFYDFKKGVFYFETFAYVCFVLFGIEVLVMAFFDRSVLSVIGVCLGVMPWLKIMVANNTKYSTSQKIVCFLFTVTSLLLAIFPRLPVIQREQHYLLVVGAGFLVATFGVMYTFFVKNQDSVVIAIQTGLLVVCIVVKMHSVSSIEHGEGLPVLNQFFSWSSLALMPCIIFVTDSTSPARLLSTIISLCAMYILTSISYEALFLLTLTVQLVTWTLLEIHVFSISTENQNSQEPKKRYLFTNDHIRISFMFVYYIFIAFFGTGNVASINSFDIASTYCFQTIFNPWIQGTILATKVLIPFLMVTIVFRSMHSMTSLPMRALFLVILLLTDLMSMHFFFLVKDQGSWLDIGQSLSHFIIALVFVIFLVPVYELSYFVSGLISLKSLKLHAM